MCESYMIVGSQKGTVGYMDSGGNVFHSSGIAINSDMELSRNPNAALSEIIEAIEAAKPMPGIHSVVSRDRNYKVIVWAEQIFRGSKPHYLAEVHPV